ncbi:hypothetical protein EV175_004062, partial [Coemansia sp. RSA 1933]
TAMPRTTASRLSSRPATAVTTSLASDLSSCGSGLVDGLPASLASSGLSLGHSDALTRKRSLDNMENIPPYFGLDSPGQLSLSASDSKPAMSLLDMTAHQLSQSQRKQRRTAITASSPGGHQRMTSNPRHIARLSETSSFLHSLPPQPHSGTNENKTTTTPSKPADNAVPQPSQSAQKPRPHIPLQPIAPKPASSKVDAVRRATFGTSSGSGGSNSSTRLRRLPKRNLKPLDFSGIHRSRMASAHSVEPSSSLSATASAKSGASSAQAAGGSAPNILSLPVSPTSPCPGTGASLALPAPSATPTSTTGACSSAHPKDAAAHSQPTPPGTVPRSQPAFSGLLASAYQRASAKRSSRRALVFDDCAPVSDDSLLDCDPVLGPRCPVIGDPRGIFDMHSNGIDVLRREQTERTESKFTEMTRAVRQAQAAFEAAVCEQKTKGRSAGKKAGASASRASTPTSGGVAGKRSISQCKYCGKQYKYHTKLASHEQHCSSRLEALLYSADDNEQHIIHCVCGPRHDYPVGERDDLPMIQCDNCFMWLHIECVGVDQNDLPNEYFCVRCSELTDSKQSRGYTPKEHSTPKRRVGLGKNGGGGGMMSPESHRLATLLAYVPDNDGSETEEEPMNLKVKGRSRRGRSSRKNNAVGSDTNADNLGSEDTMSISDVAEVTRFHRQGSAQKRSKSPMVQRMAQSEADAPAQLSPPRRRRVRASANGNQQTVHTDALSSDFLGMPLPESIFSEKPGFDSGSCGASGSVSITPGLCSQQPSMEDLTRLFTGAQPQWSLAQINNMLNCTSATGMPRHGSMVSAGSSFSLDMALADLGLGLGSMATSAGADDGAAAAAAVLANSGIQAGSSRHSMPHSFVEANTPLSELVDLSVDNEFSALLESFAGGNASGDDNNPYSSLGVDSGLGGILSDDMLLGVSSSIPLGSTSVSSAPLANNSGRTLAGRIAGPGVNIGHGSSSTITLNHDDSGLSSQDNNAACLSAGITSYPPLTRPPPGMPGVARNRSAGVKDKRSSNHGGAAVNGAEKNPQQEQQQQASSSNAAGSTAGFCLPSNPPSTSALSEADVNQLLSGTGATGQFLDWAGAGSDVLDQELEGLINFDG